MKRSRLSVEVKGRENNKSTKVVIGILYLFEFKNVLYRKVYSIILVYREKCVRGVWK